MVLESTSAIAIRNYRVGMAQALARLVEAMSENERRLNEQGLNVDFDELATSGLNADSALRSFRTTHALLLRKARLHIVAVCWANRNDNLHSLAVQMRTALECAGQIADALFLLGRHPEMPDQEVAAAREALLRLDTYYFDTRIREAKGAISPQQLLAEIRKIREEVGADAGKGRTFRLENKVESLRDGKAWYRLLGKYFCHGESVWRGYPWEGSITSTNTSMDDLAFAEFMAYLAEQASKMVLASQCFPMANGLQEWKQHWTRRKQPAATSLDSGRTSQQPSRNTSRMHVESEMNDQDWCQSMCVQGQSLLANLFRSTLKSTRPVAPCGSTTQVGLGAYAKYSTT